MPFREVLVGLAVAVIILRVYVRLVISVTSFQILSPSKIDDSETIRLDKRQRGSSVKEAKSKEAPVSIYRRKESVTRRPFIIIYLYFNQLTWRLCACIPSQVPTSSLLLIRNARPTQDFSRLPKHNCPERVGFLLDDRFVNVEKVRFFNSFAHRI